MLIDKNDSSAAAALLAHKHSPSSGGPSRLVYTLLFPRVYTETVGWRASGATTSTDLHALSTLIIAYEKFYRTRVFYESPAIWYGGV